MILLRDLLIEEKTTINLELLRDISPVIYGGCPTHRLHARAVPAGSALCGLINFSTFVQFSSSGATNYARSAENYTIMFQQIYLYAIALLSEHYSTGHDVQEEWGFVIMCPGCTKRVPETKVSLLSEPTYPGIKCFDLLTTLQVQEPAILPADPGIHPQVEAAVIIAGYLVGQAFQEDAAHAYTYEHPDTASTGACFSLIDFQRCELLPLLGSVALQLGFYRRMLANDVEHAGRNAEPTPAQRRKSEPAMYVEETMKAGHLPLQTLATNLLRCGRTWELFRICPGMSRDYSSTTTLRGVTKLLTQVVRALQADDGALAARYCRVVAPTCPIGQYTRHWYCSIRATSAVDTHKIAKSFLRYIGYCKRVKMSIPAMTDPETISEHMEGMHATFCLRAAPEIARPESTVIPLLRSLPMPRRAVHALGMRLVAPSDNPTLIRVHVPPDTTNLTTVTVPKPRDYKHLHRLCHLSRPIGNISTSASKMLDALSVFNNVVVVTHGLMVGLAEGAGSMLAGLLHLFPLSIGFYNSLLPDEDRGDDPSVFVPPALESDQCGLASRLAWLPACRAGDRDLRLVSTEQKLVSLLLRARMPISCLTMDAEAKDLDGYDQLLQTTLNVIRACCSQRSIICIKLFFATEGALAFITQVSRIAEMTYLVKPPGSDRASSEVYLMAYSPDTNRAPLSWTVSSATVAAVTTFIQKQQFLIDMDVNRYAQYLVGDGVRLAGSLVGCPCMRAYEHDLAYLNCSPYGVERDILVCLERGRTKLHFALTSSRWEDLPQEGPLALMKHLRYTDRQEHVSRILHKYMEVILVMQWLQMDLPSFVRETQSALTSHRDVTMHVHISAKACYLCDAENCQKGRKWGLLTPYKVSDIAHGVFKRACRLYPHIARGPGRQMRSRRQIHPGAPSPMYGLGRR